MTEPDTTPSSEPDRLPRHTTPTWEVELLISGVAVFAMLQLPGWLDDRVLMLRPRFDADWSDVLLIIGLYLKGAAIILAATFAVHLLLRAQWIARVGVHSVFPEGIRWERLRMGPIQREIEQTRYVSAKAGIERADNRATVFFAIGVMLATALLLVCVIAGVAMVLAGMLTHLGGGHVHGSSVLLICAAVMVLPLILAKAVDRRIGAGLRPGAPLRRLLAMLFRGYGRIGMGRGSEVMALLSSHGGLVRMTLLVFVVFLIALAGSALGLVMQRDTQALGNYALFPDMGAASGRRLDSAHYDDQRDPLRDAVAPYVQSAVVRGPYLELVVPYETARDNAALHDTCADALAIDEDGARAIATLRCLARLHAVVLDGKPLPGLRYDVGNDARSGRPVLQAMIDVRALAPGRHELRVVRSPRADDDGRAADSADWVIPFWR